MLVHWRITKQKPVHLRRVEPRTTRDKLFFASLGHLLILVQTHNQVGHACQINVFVICVRTSALYTPQTSFDKKTSVSQFAAGCLFKLCCILRLQVFLPVCVQVWQIHVENRAWWNESSCNSFRSVGPTRQLFGRTIRSAWQARFIAWVVNQQIDTRVVLDNLSTFSVFNPAVLIANNLIYYSCVWFVGVNVWLRRKQRIQELNIRHNLILKLESCKNCINVA